MQKLKWTTLEQDSPRKIDRKKLIVESASKEKEKRSPRRKNNNWHENMMSLHSTKSPTETHSPGLKFGSSNDKNEDNLNGAHSSGNMIDEQRKKVFLQKKAEMLKNFEVEKKDEEKYLNLETSSQAMKNSLDVIGDPNPRNRVHEGKLTEFGKESTSKFLQPLQNVCNEIFGKKPCARDGHCSVILNN
jgi:hypothetical protein